MDVLFEHSLPFFRASAGINTFPSEQRAPQPANYIGAVIFWSYIGAALYFLWDIVRTLVALHKFSIYRKHVYSRFGVTVFGTFALLSFVNLSYHMLNVLVQSYVSWARLSQKVMPGSPTNSATCIFTKLPSSLLLVLSDIWEWSISNSLFTDFAETITANAARWTWAQADLGVTLVTAHWMGLEGRLGTGRSDDSGVVPVPKLWSFFALLQILPVSLTQALFMVALLLSPPPSLTKRQRQQQQQQQQHHHQLKELPNGNGENKKTVVLLGKPGYWITTGLVYCFILVEATQPERRHWLILMVLIARTLLWAPLVLPFARFCITEPRHKYEEANEEKNSTGSKKKIDATSNGKGKASTKEDEEEEEENCRPEATKGALPNAIELLDKASPMQLIDMPLVLLALAGWAVLHQAYWAHQEFGVQGIIDAIDQHPAVSALGYDFLISTTIFAAWEAFGKNLRTRG